VPPITSTDGPRLPVDHDPVSDAAADAARLARSLGRFARLVSRSKAGTGDSSGFDPSTVHLLSALAEKGPQRSNALAEAVLSDPSTVSRQVSHLVDVGFVERRADPGDGRASLLAITESGRATLDEHARRRQEFLARLIAHWPPEDRQQLPDLLDRLCQDLADHLCHTPSTTQAQVLEQS